MDNSKDPVITTSQISLNNLRKICYLKYTNTINLSVTLSLFVYRNIELECDGKQVQVSTKFSSKLCLLSPDEIQLLVLLHTTKSEEGI